MVITQPSCEAGTRFVFRGDVERGSEIFSANADGSGRVQLTRRSQ